MGLLPMGADILPAYDDRIFKLILTSSESEPVLRDLISAIIQRPVLSVAVRNNELAGYRKTAGTEISRGKAHTMRVTCIPRSRQEGLKDTTGWLGRIR